MFLEATSTLRRGEGRAKVMGSHCDVGGVEVAGRQTEFVSGPHAVSVRLSWVKGTYLIIEQIREQK
jgi:hypothetical protein